ncbi:cell division protein FtsQ/DivIB [Phyllobacterium sp. 21LDTY02-6]|nr:MULTISPECIES: cell division protein FtsQ/DivIB [unclassified Phyllobacterium]MCO4315978.1 cell division protein FtsQ/DivIB [Phyllobacterium sp. 21LDTY02-6]MCX8279598.1 cell division protein FtsQ/DivIB [Phyllobacterium sp. 0TCS1.6C]MCX8292211.1 cell division protein FtsQ/DivIB [Phyllobacterium sp. 0TCS1.6A]
MSSDRSVGFGRFRVVLPRFLRKPVRVLTRLVDGDLIIPNHVGTVGAVAFLALTGAYGAIIGGHAPEVVKVTTSTFGFAIEDVKIVGNTETSEIDVLGALGLDGETSLVGLSARDAQQAVAQLPWVESVDVFKVYPNTIQISIKERKALAVWQNGSELSVIDADGRVIVPYTGGSSSALPLIIGDGADKQAKLLFAQIAAYPKIASQVLAYARLGNRRWDLILKNRIKLMLPEHDINEALAHVMEMDAKSGLLGRDIASVDMRLADRAVIRLTPEAMVQRVEYLKAREKASKRSEKRV